jgi:hypothetical protein
VGSFSSHVDKRQPEKFYSKEDSAHVTPLGVKRVCALLGVCLLVGCGEDKGLEAAEGGAKAKEAVLKPTSVESSVSVEGESDLEDQLVGYWAANFEDLIVARESELGEALPSDEREELKKAVESGAFSLMLHFPEKGRMTGYMTGQDPSVMTYEVMEVDAANRVLDVEVTGDVDFSGKVTFQEDDKIMVTRNEEKGAIIVRRIGKEAFEKLRGEPEG